MKTLMAVILAALLAVPAGAVAQEYIWDGPLAEYGQRMDSVTYGAGNAKDANAAIHTINPRPPSSRNRAIPASGERMSGAIRRYEDVTKLPQAPRPISAESGTSGSSSGSSSSGK